MGYTKHHKLPKPETIGVDKEVLKSSMAIFQTN